MAAQGVALGCHPEVQAASLGLLSELIRNEELRDEVGEQFGPETACAMLGPNCNPTHNPNRNPNPKIYVCHVRRPSQES